MELEFAIIPYPHIQAYSTPGIPKAVTQVFLTIVVNFEEVEDKMYKQKYSSKAVTARNNERVYVSQKSFQILISMGIA